MRVRALDDPAIDEQTISAWRLHLGDADFDPNVMSSRLSAGSLPQAFSRTASGAGARPALTVAHSTLSHGELDELAGRGAADLRAVGVGAGSRVLLIADVGLEEIVAYLSILRVGATAVLAHPSLTPNEIETLRLASGAECLLGSGNLLGATGALDWREALGLRATDRPVTSTILGDISGDSLPPPAIDPSTPAVLAFTSGTTGPPKPTPLSHANLLASVRSVMMAWRWDSTDHLVHSLPISHQHGLSGVHATLLAGSRASLLGAFDAEGTLDVVRNRGATVHFGVPAIHQRLLVRLGDRAAGLARLRLAVSGSGPLPVEVARRYRERIGDSLLERYGTTESGLDVSNPYDGPRLDGAVGIPLPGVEVALGSETGELRSPDEVGEVLIRGPHVFSGYEGVASGDQPFIAGWFRTGDLGVVDERSGYLQIVGRIKEVIISGGMNVYPREVEDVLRRCPGVADVAVVGVPSDEWGEEVVALVTPRDVETEVLESAANARLAPYKRPKRYVPVAEVPRTAVGKLIMDEIRGFFPPTE